MKCFVCNQKGVKLTKHHVKKGSIVMLCRKCHDIIHNQESKFNRVSPEVRRLFKQKLHIDITRKLGDG